MPANDIFELQVNMTHSGQNVTNVHHFIQVGVDGTGTWQDALKQIWLDNYKDILRALMVVAVNIVEIKLRKLFPVQTQQTASNIGEAGLVLTTGMPTHAAALIRQRATPSGRKGTGGVKICGVPIAEVDEGKISESYRDDMLTYGNISESDITDGGSGYTFRSGVLSNVDNVLRKIVKSMPTPRIVTVHSRQIGVGQ